MCISDTAINSVLKELSEAEKAYLSIVLTSSPTYVALLMLHLNNINL
jgi:hypothetical protein